MFNIALESQQVIVDLKTSLSRQLIALKLANELTTIKKKHSRTDPNTS